MGSSSWTRSACTEITESSPPDHQGRTSVTFFKKLKIMTIKLNYRALTVCRNCEDEIIISIFQLKKPKLVFLVRKELS